MKIKSSVSFILGFFLQLPLLSQNSSPVITFAEREFNFGTFSEAVGTVTHNFEFTNTGKSPLIINEAQVARFLNAFDDVMANCHKFPGSAWKVTKDLAAAAVKSNRMAKEEKNPPKIAMFGASVFPFPHPVKELAETFHNAGTTICYDSA
jgi:hypothetical protein